jgi:prepilin-type N-terminal cleavage/methylation domain-containing protein
MKVFCRRPKVEGRKPNSFAQKIFRARRRAFTLIELMIVVGIIGLMAAMGLPSILQSLKKEGMRKALGDVVDVCNDARSHAILTGQTAVVTFHPADKKFESSGGKAATLPDGVDFDMVDPNGTCDEMTIVLHSADEWHKITLEFSTSIATVSDVDK